MRLHCNIVIALIPGTRGRHPLLTAAMPASLALSGLWILRQPFRPSDTLLLGQCCPQPRLENGDSSARTGRETDCGTIDLSYLNNKYKKSDRTERRMATSKSQEPWGQPTPKMPISSVLQNFLRYCRIQCCPSNYCCPPNCMLK